jgi:hypothetical protein
MSRQEARRQRWVSVQVNFLLALVRQLGSLQANFFLTADRGRSRQRNCLPGRRTSSGAFEGIPFLSGTAGDEYREGLRGAWREGRPKSSMLRRKLEADEEDAASPALEATPRGRFRTSLSSYLDRIMWRCVMPFHLNCVAAGGTMTGTSTWLVSWWLIFLYVRLGGNLQRHSEDQVNPLCHVSGVPGYGARHRPAHQARHGPAVESEV